MHRRVFRIGPRSNHPTFVGGIGRAQMDRLGSKVVAFVVDINQVAGGVFAAPGL